MKSIFFFLLVSLICMTSVKAEAPDTTKIPDKWKKESLIILQYKYEQELKVSGIGWQRIKIVYYLRDKWGLDEVSQINLPYAIEGNIGDGSIGKIYKKSGEEISIDTTHLIPQKVTIDINNSSKNKSVLSLESQKGRKLAVPFIEVGDILEINYTVNTNNVPNEIPLINEFCMLKYEISMTINNAVTYGYYSPNYEFKNRIMNSAVEFKTNSSNSFFIEVDNVDKYKEEILNDNFTQIPYVLVVITNGVGSNYDYTKLSGEELENKQRQHVSLLFENTALNESSVAGSILSKLTSKYPKIADTVKFVTDAYYYYRESVAGETAFLGFGKNGYRNDYFFVNVMGRVLTAKGINYRAFLSQESHYGGVKNTKDMVAPVYGITLPGKNVHLFNPLYNIDPNNIPSYFENQNYITFNANKYYTKPVLRWWPFVLTASIAAFYTELGFTRAKSKPGYYNNPSGAVKTVARNTVLIGASGLVFVIVKHSIKKSQQKKHVKFGYEEKSFQYVPPQNNSIKNEIIIENILPVANRVKVNSVNKFYGKMRIDELRTLANYTNVYYEKENEYTKKTTPSAYAKPQTSEEKEREVKRMNKVFKNELEDDNFEVDEIKNYSIQQADFFNTDAPVEYTIDFTAKNMATETGNYLIVQAGKLIGSQLRVGEENADRTQDFYIPFQKQFEKSIKIKIPTGYTIQNLEEFNVSRQTSAGKFVTTASISGEYFVLNSVKTYAFQYYEREDVDDIYSFLKLAQEFENKRLILKK